VSFAYLASPYSPVGVTDREHAWRIREDRFHAACKAAAALMRKGLVVFCPIAMSHPVEAYFDEPQNGEFWKRQDEPYLNACSRLIVLTLPGWGLSNGVAHEISVAAARGIPIEYVTPESLDE
jgi:hypothetical protein